MPSLAPPSLAHDTGTPSDSEDVQLQLHSSVVALPSNEALERADSHDDSPVPPNPEARDDSEERVTRRSTNATAQLKRKLSPSTPSSPNPNPNVNAAPTPAPQNLAATVPRGQKQDPMTCAAAPQLIPPTTALGLPTSPFEFYTTRAHPVNQRGYRYIPCGPSPYSQLPTPVQRVIESAPQGARWSWEDRSTFVLVTEDAKTITAEKGWRAARANVGLREGNWYWEIRVHRAGGVREPDVAGGKEGSWVRLGVGRREAPLNAPVGFDGHSYAYRDKGGDAVTLARPTPYGKPFTSGTTIGVYLSLPPQPAPPETDPSHPSRLIRKRVPIRYKGSLYFELLEYSPSKEMEQLAADPAHLKTARPLEDERKKVAPGKRAPLPNESDEPPVRDLPTLPGAKLAFWLDGECQGVAFEDLFDFVPLPPHEGDRARVLNKKNDPRLNNHDDGTLGYYPFASVFGGAIVEINPGPEFAFPPPEDIEACLKDSPRPPRSDAVVDAVKGKGGWRPLCERYPEWLKEQAWLDDQDELEQVRQFEEQIAGRIGAMQQQQQQQRRQEEEDAGPVKKTRTEVAAVTEEVVKKESPGHEESPAVVEGEAAGISGMDVDAQ